MWWHDTQLTYGLEKGVHLSRQGGEPDKVPLPIVVGFGIRTPERAAEIAESADGAAVGTAFVEAIRDTLDDAGAATDGTVDAVLNLTRDLAGGVRSVAR